MPTRSRERIAKARRLTVHWLAYLSFFFATVQTRLNAFDFPVELEQALHNSLSPALYLQRVAARSSRAESTSARPDACLSDAGGNMNEGWADL